MAGKRDAKFWKKQYDDLTLKFKGLKVDPEAHDRVQKELAAAKQEITRLKQQVGGLKGRITQQAARHEQKVQEAISRDEIHKATVTKLHESISNLRQNLVSEGQTYISRIEALESERDAIKAADTDMRAHYTVLFATLKSAGVRRMIQAYNSRGLDNKSVHRMMRIINQLHKAVTAETKDWTAEDFEALRAEIGDMLPQAPASEAA